MRRAVAVAICSVLLAACGEPAADVEVPQRELGQMVLDQADILDDEAVAGALGGFEQRDVVALTYFSSQAGLGEADRAGRELLARWEADIALVAVAPQDNFTSEEENRQRFFGLAATDAYAVPRGLRERVVEELAPPIAAENDWTRVFLTAANELKAGLE